MAAIAADSNLASAFDRHFISFSSAFSEFYQDIYGCSSIQSLQLSDYLLFAGTAIQMWRINMAEMENDSVTEIKKDEIIISRVNATEKDNIGAADRTSTTASSPALEGSILQLTFGRWA